MLLPDIWFTPDQRLMPALLCHEEIAQGSQRPLLGAWEHKGATKVLGFALTDWGLQHIVNIGSHLRLRVDQSVCIRWCGVEMLGLSLVLITTLTWLSITGGSGSLCVLYCEYDENIQCNIVTAKSVTVGASINNTLYIEYLHSSRIEANSCISHQTEWK